MKTRLLAFTTILCLLALAILATIYLAWLCYPLEISWQKLDQVVYMKPNQIMVNVNILMDYLTNPFSQQLNMPDFPSSKSGLKHFADVKHLFHLAQLLFIVLLYPAYRFAKHKGYGSKEHFAALRELGPCPMHRKTFRGVLPERQTARQGSLL